MWAPVCLSCSSFPLPPSQKQACRFWGSLMLLKLLFSDLPKRKALGSCQEAPLSPQAPPQSASPYSALGPKSKEHSPMNLKNLPVLLTPKSSFIPN